MSWEFKPGMKVVCVAPFEGSPEKRLMREIWPEVGKIYTIRDIVHGG